MSTIAITPDRTERGKSERGVIGGRELVAVQTFDVARLTTHVTPVVPGTFNAVSGRGPKGDSNGSGKTSFLAAVTLLMADPQWRLEIDGGQTASGLLFKPEAAGVEGSRYAAAQHGYIVGVFTNPDISESRAAKTVWIRLSRSTPYLQARVADDVVVASGETEEERYEQMDALWASLARGGTTSARALSQTLYGEAPRCMAYLDTTLRRAAPSLLSQQMTEMDPAAIGQSLIDLAGMRSKFDSEEESRSTAAAQERKLADAVAIHERRTREEDAELEGIDHREKAREHLRRGDLMWKLHFAKRYTEIVPEHARATQALTDAEDTVRLLKAAVNDEQDACSALRRRTDLDKAVEETRAQHLKGQRDRESIDVRAHALREQIASKLNERVGLAAAADGWGGQGESDADRAVIAAVQEETRAQDAFDTARGAVADAQAALEAAKVGSTPATVTAYLGGEIGCQLRD